MHIQNLTLERYRGVQSLNFALHDRLNVFVGMNGAGKSSVLDATTILLSWLVNRIKTSNASGRPVLEMDIRNSEAAAKVMLSLQYRGKSYEWSITKARKGYSIFETGSNLAAVSALARGIQSDLADNIGQARLPLFAYYPVQRAVLDIPLRIREKHSFDLLSAYDESLTGGANFRTFFEWFREREDLENEARRDQDTLFASTDRMPFPDPHLETVRKALAEFMPDFTNLSVRRNPLRMEVKKNGRQLAVNQLSDGEKCLMAMIGDMARRLAIANPGHENPLAGEGIFLIDEIDLHLHPKWQRMIVPQLTTVFPNCQFLISTHSPHVITHVQPENLFLLTMTGEGLVLDRADESYGKTVDRVLEDLMGLETTRPNEVSQAIREVYAQIDKNLLEKAKSSIEKLEARIGMDTELVKAKVLIKRKELIGK